MKKLSLIIFVCLIFQISYSQSIEFTQIPTWASTKNLEGKVFNTIIEDNKILIYLYFEGYWWVKPYGGSPFTPIQPDSTWVCDVTTGGCDIYAVRYIAFIVPIDFVSPGISFQQSLPAYLYNYPHLLHCRIPGNRNLSFSGYNWIVKQSECTMGPDNNYWTDDEDDVFIDEDSNLNLSLVYKNNKWYCSEIIGDTVLGYGEYSFTINSTQNYTPNSVLGFFTWDEYANNDSYKEIDIEYSQWGNPSADNYQYVIQPWNTSGNRYRFNIPSVENTIHKFIWKYDTVEFVSMNGDSSLINSWTYTGGDYHEPSSTVNPRINLWKFQQAPSQTVNVKISEFGFKNLLDTPDGIEVSKGTETSKIVIYWNEVLNAQYYGVYRHTYDDPLEAELLSESWIEGFTYEDTDVQQCNIYYYYIRCSDNISGSNITGYASAFSNAQAGWVTNYEVIDVSVFQEGCFNGTTMNTDLNSSGYLPLNQPYFTNPWNYPGNESVAAIPDTNIVDWILMEIRSTHGEPCTATKSTMIARQAAFLLNTGQIKGLNGSYPLVFNIPVSENLYIVIWHRNHLSIMSAYPLIESNGIFTYDFTTGEDKAYGGSSAHKEIAPGVWGMVGGDGNADGQTDNKDKDDVWLIQKDNTGYYSGDFNMDNEVNDIDKIIMWQPNAGKGSKVPE